MHAEERIRCYVHVYLCLNRKKWEGKRERDRELIVLRGETTVSLEMVPLGMKRILFSC